MPQRLKLYTSIKEDEVEESFVSDLDVLRELLGFQNDLKLIARQLRLRGGEQRIDLFLLCGRKLLLVELKVTGYRAEYKDQVLGYKQELENLQKQNELPQGEISYYLLVTESVTSQVNDCLRDGVVLIKYAPEDVLTHYYNNLLRSTHFLRIKPNDYGVFSLGLINRALSELQHGESDEKVIASKTGLSKNSIHNHLRTAAEFGLVRKRNTKYFLTDFGDKYVEAQSEGKLRDVISNEQAEMIKRYISKAPFSSSMVFGVYAIVESAFLLARNRYPIEFDDLTKHFTTISGKETEWRANKSRATATYTFLNFAIDLGLLGKIGRRIVITPSGFRFILMLQLHKSIEMIDSLPR